MSHYKKLFACLLREHEWDLCFIEGHKLLKEIAVHTGSPDLPIANELGAVLSDGVDMLKAHVEALALNDDLSPTDQVQHGFLLASCP